MPRISQLPSLAAADNADEIAIVDVSASTTKKITRGDLLKAPLPANSVTTAAIADGSIDGSKISNNAITIGYASKTTNFTTTTIGSHVPVTGMSATATIPSGGRNIKVSVHARDIYRTTAGTHEWVIWDGAVGSGTRIASSLHNIAANNAVPLDLSGIIIAASAGSKTFNLSVIVQGLASTVGLEAAADSPAYILVEAI